MPEKLNLQTFTDKRGNLTVIEKILPFEIKRIFYIYGVDYETRGEHRHIKTIQAAICLKGSCTIIWNNGNESGIEKLGNPSTCLILFPQDFHIINNFSTDAILMVLASEYYDLNDYVYLPYSKK